MHVVVNLLLWKKKGEAQFPALIHISLSTKGHDWQYIYLTWGREQSPLGEIPNFEGNSRRAHKTWKQALHYNDCWTNEPQTKSKRLTRVFRKSCHTTPLYRALVKKEIPAILVTFIVILIPLKSAKISQMILHHYKMVGFMIDKFYNPCLLPKLQ